MSSGLEGDWDKIANILNPARMKAKLTVAAKKVGAYGASAVKKGIVSGAPGGKKFVPLSPMTIANKGSSSPLIDKGDLVGSVTYATPNENTVFIGVRKSAKSKDGGALANVAAVHEFGCTIRVTPKMRAYLHYQGIHLKSSTQYISVPPRPYLRPTLDDPEFREKIAEIYAKAIKEAFMP